MTDKGMTRNTQNRFNKTNPRTGYDETSVLQDEVKAAEASADFWKWSIAPLQPDLWDIME